MSHKAKKKYGKKEKVVVSITKNYINETAIFDTI